MKNAIELFSVIGCTLVLLVQLLRIVWLYFPSFMQKTKIYKVKIPKKPEMLIYFIAAIIILLYHIVVTAKKIF
jgi:hypothetical protein